MSDAGSARETGQTPREAFEVWCENATAENAQAFMVGYADALLVELETQRQRADDAQAQATAWADALAAARQERDNLDENLTRVQRHLKHSVSELAAVRQRETPDEGTEVRLSFAEAVHQIRDHLTRLSNAPHEEHFGPFCPICGLIGSLRRTMEDWRP